MASALNNIVSLTDMITKPTIVYGNDPLCGWCFAISPQITLAKKVLGERVKWKILCGGLVLGERVRPVSFDSDYLRAGFAQVKQACGREPSHSYWDDVVAAGTWVSNSEPSCRAIFAAQHLASDAVAIEFSHGLTDALYVDGLIPEDPATLRKVAESVGIDAHELVRFWSSTEAKELTETSFADARRFGITTYPSLFLLTGSTATFLGAGFMSAGDIVDAVERSLGQRSHQ
jgi:putative protein-disulfide isomerase